MSVCACLSVEESYMILSLRLPWSDGQYNVQTAHLHSLVSTQKRRRILLGICIVSSFGPTMPRIRPVSLHSLVKQCPSNLFTMYTKQCLETVFQLNFSKSEENVNNYWPDPIMALCLIRNVNNILWVFLKRCIILLELARFVLLIRDRNCLNHF